MNLKLPPSCSKEYKKNYYLQNRKVLIKKQKIYNFKHREEIKERRLKEKRKKKQIFIQLERGALKNGKRRS